MLQAAWIALSGRYPMAFDEDFHFGLIKIYSNHFSPFWNSHLEGSEAYGAISRDPSYMYHLVFGGIYKVIKVFTENLYYQVMTLRFINIGLFATGIIIFNRLLLKTKMSQRLINYVLFVFILIPVVPLLGAQINYDNLMFPLVGISLLLALKVSETLKSKKPSLSTILTFIFMLLIISLVKYAFLPIAVAAVLFLLFYNRQGYRKLFSKKSIVRAFNDSNKGLILLLTMGIVIFASLHIERYGVNLINYHKPVADCSEVLNYDKCQSYGPWIRDYNFEKAKPQNANTSIVRYMPEWVYGMWFRSFFSVDGPGTLYQTRGPLLYPALISIFMLIISPIIVLISYKKILKMYSKPTIYLFSAVIIIYVLSLWLEEFRLFRKTAQPVAINGRYLVLIMPLMFGLIAMSFSELIKGKLRYVLACIVLFMLLFGGGASTYILRSNSAWYWPNSDFINHVNWTLQRTIGPLTPGFSNQNMLQK